MYNPKKVREKYPDANLIGAEQIFSWLGKFQTQLLPSKPSELKEEHLEWCYNSADGVRGIRGKVLKRPQVTSDLSIGLLLYALNYQTTFHGPTLAGVEEHFYEESGLLGFKRFFDSPFAR